MRLTRASSPPPDAIHPFKLTLPPALLDKATTRLVWVSLIAAASTVCLFAVEGLLQPEIKALQGTPAIRTVGLAILLLSAGFMLLGRAGVLSKQAFLNVGVLYQVVIAFGISMFENTLPMEDGLVRGVSNVAVWISLCGILIPNTPLMSLLGSLGSALTWLLAHLVSCGLHGYPPLPPNRLLAWMAPLVLCGLWVCFLNQRAIRLQLKQQQAEEMGAYQLHYQIGRGGMGEVWRASHRMLARDSAIKLIRPDVLALQSDRYVQMLRRRFEREARVTASLKSRHTVALYDFGVSQEGAFYYVMELLNGLDLQTLVDRFGPLPPARVVHLLRQLCLSLGEAHRAGLVHRDIKPKNIFLCSFGLEHDLAKVLDFGLVKSTAGLHHPSEESAEATVAGTPAYMPPEMALGSPGVDGRADLYSLGCVAYFLLSGSLVFDARSATALAMAHVQSPAVPLSSRCRQPIPADLEQLIMACLEKLPSNRPRDAQELSRRLDRLELAGAWTDEAAAQWWNTHLPDLPTRPPADSSEDVTATQVVIQNPACGQVPLQA